MKIPHFKTFTIAILFCIISIQNTNAQQKAWDKTANINKGNNITPIILLTINTV